MAITYSKEVTPYGEAIIKDNDGVISIIPIDESNADYQRYLNPEAEQSTPIVIDEAKIK
jgi:hypothetical protein